MKQWAGFSSSCLWGILLVCTAGCAATSAVINKGSFPKESVTEYKEAYEYEGNFVLTYMGMSERGYGEHWLSISMDAVERAKTNVTLEATLHRESLPKLIQERAQKLLIYISTDEANHVAYLNLTRSDGSKPSIRISNEFKPTSNAWLILLPLAIPVDLVTLPIQFCVGASHLGELNPG